MRLIHYRKSIPNFGDELNVELWPALAPELFDEDRREGFVGIGTIIGFDVDETHDLHVFSSGTGYDRIDAWKDKNVWYHCVRGPLSARLLGLDPNIALTDGAVMTPLAPMFPDKASGGGGTLVIPHFETLEFPGWEEAVRAAGFTLVDPRGTPAEVIGKIAAADLVLTESLHGAILADIYGVPWIAFATSRNFSVAKWTDWTASVEIPLDLSIVPPPDVRHLLHFGKRPEPFGSRASFTLEDGLAEFRAWHQPSAGPSRSTLRDKVKQLVKSSALLRPLMGFSVARTAAALSELATRPTSQSSRQVTQDRRDAMGERLSALRAGHAARR